VACVLCGVGSSTGRCSVSSGGSTTDSIRVSVGAGGRDKLQPGRALVYVAGAGVLAPVQRPENRCEMRCEQRQRLKKGGESSVKCFESP